jgi:hypothetical protein
LYGCTPYMLDANEALAQYPHNFCLLVRIQARPFYVVIHNHNRVHHIALNASGRGSFSTSDSIHQSRLHTTDRQYWPRQHLTRIRPDDPWLARLG